jgi:RES domain-containing protein
MKIFRIALSQYCDDSGEGAKKYGGRWNLPGCPALYACSNVAAALLERLTIDSELFSSERYVRYSIMEFQCDDALIYKPNLAELPPGWDAIPFTKASQEFGTAQLMQGTLCFVVPSVVDVTSMNAVVNPMAKNFSKIRWRVYPLTLDQRIVR